jgi:serine/threonine-protein kinase
VYVSSGKEQVKVPDVTNTSLADAQAQMEALGLTSGAVTKQASATVPADVVLTTNPVGGTMADAGSSVDFVVSSGMVTLPNLVGNTLQVATDTLQGEDLQLTPNPVGDPSCEQQPNMPIIRQSLAPGAVPQGSTIDLSYCSG